MIPSDVAASQTLTSLLLGCLGCGEGATQSFHKHKAFRRSKAKEECPLTTCSRVLLLNCKQCFDSCQLLLETWFRWSVETLAVALAGVVF